MWQVIDKKTDSNSWAFGIVKADVTLTLVETDSGKFGILYEASYKSPVKSGSVKGGPIDVHGNGSWTVSDNPQVTVALSNWSLDDRNHLISCHIDITANVLSKSYTAFNETLGGRYNVNTVEEFLAAMADAARPVG